MIYCTQIDKLNMHYIAKYQYVKLIIFLRIWFLLVVKSFFTLKQILFVQFRAAMHMI